MVNFLGFAICSYAEYSGIYRKAFMFEVFGKKLGQVMGKVDFEAYLDSIAPDKILGK
jgi:hypothetical protein